MKQAIHAGEPAYKVTLLGELTLNDKRNKTCGYRLQGTNNFCQRQNEKELKLDVTVGGKFIIVRRVLKR